MSGLNPSYSISMEDLGNGDKVRYVLEALPEIHAHLVEYLLTVDI